MSRTGRWMCESVSVSHSIIFACSPVSPFSRNFLFFFLNDPAPPEISTLSLHAALPIWRHRGDSHHLRGADGLHHQPLHFPLAHGDERLLRRQLAASAAHRGSLAARPGRHDAICRNRSEEHTSELQSQSNLVCRLLLEKK